MLVLLKQWNIKMIDFQVSESKTYFNGKELMRIWFGLFFCYIKFHHQENLHKHTSDMPLLICTYESS